MSESPEDLSIKTSSLTEHEETYREETETLQRSITVCAT